MAASLAAAVALAAAASATPPVEVTAAFVPAARAGSTPAVEVRFASADPAVHVIREPAPRLELEPLQRVLKISPAARPARTGGAPPAKYLGPAEPYRFPVTVAKDVAAGTHAVKGTVTYFYCSQREGWCRKAANDVEVAVKLR